MAKEYSLHRSKKIFLSAYRVYKWKKKKLTAHEQKNIQDLLHSLYDALERKDVFSASHLAKNVEEITKGPLKKTPLEKAITLSGTLIFALFAAILIRQMWFELYTIPTGSMRPTLKENDFLVVSKTDYGINTPRRTGHFTFDPTLVKRGQVVVFSGEGMDINDVNTMYFYLIPGKKQYIKRLIAKPGDSLYFYGGQIYGIDKDNEEILDFKNESWFSKLEHIPYIHLEGKVHAPGTVQNGIFTPVFIYQMNIPIAKLTSSFGSLNGEMLYDETISPKVENFSDLWGIGHYASTRVLTKTEVLTFYGLIPEKDTPLYLELTHHASLNQLRLIKDFHGRLRPALDPKTSILPLDNEHIDRLMSHIYTCRFTVKNSRAYPINTPRSSLKYSIQFPVLKDIPNGTYEILNGKAYQVYLTGLTKELPSDHPLLNKTPQNLQLLYNLGVVFNNFFLPESKMQDLRPFRYAYFRDRDLYLLGYPIFFHDEPDLVQFLDNEQKNGPLAFVDRGPPVKSDGTLDKEFIQTYGMKMPDSMYLVLGDNHAMSADSREFGFVPEKNLRGRAGFIFWPPSSRWGLLPQAPSSWLTIPSLTIYLLGAGGFYLFFLYTRKRKPKF